MTGALSVGDRGTRLAIAVVLGFVALHLIAGAVVPLSPDETYYLSWSRFPAWSYYDHPPMIAWWIWAGTHLSGETPLGVRLFAILSLIPSSWALYATGRVLFEARMAALAAIWINATLLVGVGGISATPDAPSVMFWAFGTLGLARLVQTRNGRWWLLIGAAAGLGVASKLTDLFLPAGVVLALLVTADRRRLLMGIWPFLGLATAIVILLPMIVWNADHDWITFTKQFSRVARGGLQPLHLPEFFVTQFALLNPLVASFLGLGLVARLRRDLRYPLAGIDLLVWSVLLPVAYMTIHALHAQIPGNWLAPIYPTLALIAAAAAVVAPPERWAAGRALAAPLGAALSVLGLIGAMNPGGILPRALDPGQVLHGWEDVAHEVDAYRRQTGAAWIGVDYYGMVGELQWRLTGVDVPVLGIVERHRYDYAPPPEAALAARPVLLVTRSKLPEAVSACFDGLTLLGSIDRKSGNDVLATYTVYQARSADPRVFTAGCGG